VRVSFFGSVLSGKTTHADILVDKYGFTKLSFATEIKEVGKIMLGREINKMTDRFFLIQLGDVMRGKGSTPDLHLWVCKNTKMKCYFEDNQQNFTQLFWYAMEKRNLQNIPLTDDFFVKWMETQIETNRDIVVDDLRFTKEYDMLNTNGFKFIYLTCPKSVIHRRAIQRDGGFDISVYNEPSENIHKNFDYNYGINTDYNLDYTADSIAAFLGLEG